MRWLSRRTRMLLPFIWRDIREQYAGSLLGTLWSVFEPAFFILLYWLVFSRILQVRIPAGAAGDAPFLPYLLSGLLPWLAFQQGVVKSAGAVVARRELVKKVHLPIQIFPLAAVAAAYVSHGIGFALFLVAFFLWKGQVAAGQLVAIAVLLALQFMATAGLGMLFAALTVYLRDTAQVLGVALQAIFYTAPILYPLAIVPEELQLWVHLNPFTVFAEAYHGAVLWAAWPSPGALAGLGLFTVAVAWGGRHVFRRLQPGFADVL